MTSSAADQLLSAEASLALGDSYYIDENYEQALDAYAIALLSDDNRNATTFRLHSHKAAALLKLERYAEVVEDCQLALHDTVAGVRGDETEACQYQLGVAWMKLEDTEKALESFQQATQLASLNQRPVTKYQECVDKMMKMTVKPAPTMKTAPKTAPTAATKAEEDDDKLVVEEVARKAPPLPPATSTVPRSAVPKKPTMPKYQYYQSGSVMTIAILESNVSPDQVRVDFRPRKLTVILTKQGVDFTVICGRLFDSIVVEKSKVVCKEAKVLVKLRKKDPHDWHELFSKAAANADDDEEEEEKPKAALKSDEPQEVPKDQNPNRPYASTRDWNAIERNLKQEEAQEKPEGEDAMNSLFAQIYGKADDATKRAMIKSYQTSGGTCLSTNWDEVKDKDYENEREAPKGMEWKTWEGDKVKEGSE